MKRPKLKIYLTTNDKILEIIGVVLIIVIWFVIIINYSKLPNTIPTHYNLKGEANSFGHKASIFILPIVTTIIYIGLTILNKHPHVFNYLEKITKQNALHKYTQATRFLRWLKLSVLIFFGFIILCELNII